MDYNDEGEKTAQAAEVTRMLSLTVMTTAQHGVLRDNKHRAQVSFTMLEKFVPIT